MTEVVALAVTHPQEIAVARRAATRIAADLGWGESEVGRVALVVTEAATNLLKHARDGEILVHAADGPEAPAVEILALDRHPGMADVGACLRDGYSTAGSPGTGLGAIRRLATTFDAYSVPGLGTAVLAVVGPPRGARAAVEIGGVAVPKPGETTCGDAWATQGVPAGARIVLADGLGHGPEARVAARTAVRLFGECRGIGLTEAMERMHAGLRTTRGAAIGLAELDLERRQVRFVGIGNVAGVVWAPGASRHLVSHGGTAGHEARRVQVFTSAWPAGGLLLLHSDGVSGHWRLDRYPGLAARHPTLVAGVLYRDHRRGSDDAAVVVAREAA